MILKNTDVNEKTPTLQELMERNASCFELAWYGYIRIYEKGETVCQCCDCLAMKKIASDLDKLGIIKKFSI